MAILNESVDLSRIVSIRFFFFIGIVYTSGRKHKEHLVDQMNMKRSLLLRPGWYIELDSDSDNDIDIDIQYYSNLIASCLLSLPHPISSVCACRLALPCLALPCLALDDLALPCLGSPEQLKVPEARCQRQPRTCGSTPAPGNDWTDKQRPIAPGEEAAGSGSVWVAGWAAKTRKWRGPSALAWSRAGAESRRAGILPRTRRTPRWRWLARYRCLWSENNRRPQV